MENHLPRPEEIQENVVFEHFPKLWPRVRDVLGEVSEIIREVAGDVLGIFGKVFGNVVFCCWNMLTCFFHFDHMHKVLGPEHNLCFLIRFPKKSSLGFSFFSCLFAEKSLEEKRSKQLISLLTKLLF